MGLSFAFCIGAMVGWKDVWCNGEDPNTFGGGACTVQVVYLSYMNSYQHTS